MFLYMVMNHHQRPSRLRSLMDECRSQDQKLASAKEEIRSYQFWKAVRCEFLITLLYVFIGCGTTIAWKPETSSLKQHHSEEFQNTVASGPSDVSQVALAFGLTTATLVQCVGHISGAHMNPAVTVAMLVTRNITLLRSVMYALAQCLGGVAGAGILYGVTPSGVMGTLGVTKIHRHMALGQAFGVEFMITFILVFAVFANMEPKRIDMGSRSLAVGLAVTVGHLFALLPTGASMNPARSLGPAIVMNIWTNHWVYWVGPILGGIIGGFTYEYTHDSSNQLQYLRKSCRRRPANLKRSRSILSTNSTASTEMTCTPTSEDIRI